MDDYDARLIGKGPSLLLINIHKNRAPRSSHLRLFKSQTIKKDYAPTTLFQVGVPNRTDFVIQSDMIECDSQSKLGF